MNNKKYLERVTCLLCDKDCLLKNLTQHNKAKHDSQPLKYKSAVSSDISTFFKTPKEPETKDEEVIIEPPSKQTCLQSDIPEETNTKSPCDSAVLTQISNQLTALSSEVQMLRTEINAFRAKESCQIATVSPTPVTKASTASANDFNEHDEKLLLVTHARSFTSILKYLDNWTLSEDGLKCVPCGIVVKYDHFSEGTDFDKDDIIPQSFSNMKKSIIRHLDCETHIKSLKLFENAKAKEQELLDSGKKCGINCASAAYTFFYFAESKQSYEHHVADIFTAGGLVGSKNHSKNFPALFLPHLYDILRSSVSNYMTENNRFWSSCRQNDYKTLDKAHGRN